MRCDGDEPEAGSEAENAQAPRLPEWRALRGGGAPNTEANIRLRREFKGVTVGDLLADEDLLARLPGRVRSALGAVRSGDLERADKALPGSFDAAAETSGARVMPGPGHRRRQREASMRFLVFVLATCMLAALLLVFA